MSLRDVCIMTSSHKSPEIEALGDQNGSDVAWLNEFNKFSWKLAPHLTGQNSKIQTPNPSPIAL